MKASHLDRRTLLLSGSALLMASACRAALTSSSADENRARSPRSDLYNCEGCDGAYERPSANLPWSTRITSANELGEPLVIEGRVLKLDGKSPASDVIVYAYHTNAAGVYGNGSNESEWSRRHGRLRGWIKTGVDGRYRFETIKPAPYPHQTMPAHIHLTVLEPGKRPYYIDDIVFDGEFGVTEAYRARQEFRGGSGIVKLGRTPDGRLLAVRDIVLERHPE